MTKSRLEAFSDGVIAIIITVMLLELKAPHGYSFEAIQQLWPEMCSYILSYVMLGIYWNNHHHLFQAVKHISGSVMWANLHLLFWLSLLPFATEWMRDGCFVGPPVAIYGFVLFMSGIAYWLMTISLINLEGRESAIAKAIGSDRKGKGSLVFYATAIVVSYWAPYVSCAIYVLVAMIWFVPDRRFAHAHLGGQESEHVEGPVKE